MIFDVKPFTSPIPVDCGSTCLKMLLDYYGVDVELNELNAECNVGIIGCTAGDIKRAAANHGVEIKAFKMESSELIMQDRPAIVWWRKNHFCVYCGVDENKNIVLIDPDKGRFRMSKNLFDLFYAGKIALFVGEPVSVEDVYLDGTDVAEILADHEMRICLMELGVDVDDL